MKYVKKFENTYIIDVDVIKLISICLFVCPLQIHMFTEFIILNIPLYNSYGINLVHYKIVNLKLCNI